MIKLKSFLVLRYPQIYKFYSKSAEKVIADLGLVKTTEKGSSHNSVSGLDPTAESSAPSKSADNSKVQCRNIARNVDRKGKKCGQPKPVASPVGPGPPGGAYIIDKCGFYNIPKSNSKKWKRISLVLLPIVVALSALILTGTKEHPKRQFVPYEHMYIRNKRFPWGDGKKSLFHGPNNFIPEEETNSNKEP